MGGINGAALLGGAIIVAQPDKRIDSCPSWGHLSKFNLGDRTAFARRAAREAAVAERKAGAADAEAVAEESAAPVAGGAAAATVEASPAAGMEIESSSSSGRGAAAAADSSLSSSSSSSSRPASSSENPLVLTAVGYKELLDWAAQCKTVKGLLAAGPPPPAPAAVPPVRRGPAAAVSAAPSASGLQEGGAVSGVKRAREAEAGEVAAAAPSVSAAVTAPAEAPPSQDTQATQIVVDDESAVAAVVSSSSSAPAAGGAGAASSSEASGAAHLRPKKVKRKDPHAIKATKLTLWQRQELVFKGADSLIIASEEDPLQHLLACIRFMKPAGAVSIFHNDLSVLTNCYRVAKHLNLALSAQLSEIWTRDYQVLPERTHPVMSTHGASSYTLTFYVSDNKYCVL